jgi:hypothetical protein
MALSELYKIVEYFYYNGIKGRRQKNSRFIGGQEKLDYTIEKINFAGTGCMTGRSAGFCAIILVRLCKRRRRNL